MSAGRFAIRRAILALNLRALHHKARRLGQFRVFHGDGNFREPQWRPLHRTIKNAIRHPLRAQRLVALFAQHPGDGVHHIRFSAAIRAHDAGSPRSAERHHRAFAERLKAHNFNFSQLKQGFLFGSLRAREPPASCRPGAPKHLDAAAHLATRDESLFLGRKAGTSTETLAGSR